MAYICHCVSGPPSHGICNACGAPGPYYGPPYPWRHPPKPIDPPRPVVIPPPLTEEDVRRIIREELERAKNE